MSVAQSQSRWNKFAEIIWEVIPRHKHKHFNMIAQMNRRELEEFVDDNKYVVNIIPNSRLSAENAKILSMVTYAKNLLRLRS
jgi:hypothetical protein